MPLVTIDGHPIEVERGTSIIQAADRLGVEIPRFCYHPDLVPEGNCRMCLVAVRGFPRPVVACATPVQEGMAVATAHTDPEIRQAVNGVLEFLLVNHPLDCPICDQAGECSLQDFYMNPDYGLHASDVDLSEKIRKRKAIDLGPMVVLDSERCVMCSRCVRFSRDISGYSELQFVRRGNHVEIATFNDQPLSDPYSGNLVDLCPVGALTSKDFRFKRRVWYLSSTPSICPGCSTGCNVRIDHDGGRIERLVPRRNPGVNASWMCDEGRLGFRRFAAMPRVTQPSRRVGGERQVAEWSQALAEVARGLQEAWHAGGADGPSAILGSCNATNEALWALRRLSEVAPEPVWLDARLEREDALVDVREDGLLRRQDKHANTRGAMLLGLTRGDGGLGPMAARARQGALAAVVVLYQPSMLRDLPQDVLENLAAVIAAARFSVVLTPVALPVWEAATWVLPVAGWGEEEGTYTQAGGQVQHLAAAMAPPGAARPALAVLAQLVGALNGPTLSTRPEEVFALELAGAVPAYRGLTYAALPSRHATAYPPEGRMPYGREGFAGR